MGQSSSNETVLGKGGFGDVSKIKVGKEYHARKNVNTPNVHAKNVFNREIAIMQYLKKYCDEYIICFKSVTDGKKSSTYDMEFIKGSSNLKNILMKKDISTRRRLKIMLHLAKGLQHIHNVGVVHRDIKPQNIVVAVNRRGKKIVKYIDFGIACMNPAIIGNEELRRVMEQCITQSSGTRTYMAPELFTTQNKTFSIYEKSDIWSLGVTFLYIAYGVTIVPSSTNIRIVQKYFLEFPKTSKELLSIIFTRQKYLYTRGERNRNTKFDSNEFGVFLLNILRVNPDERLSLENIIGWLEHEISLYK